MVNKKKVLYYGNLEFLAYCALWLRIEYQTTIIKKTIARTITTIKTLTPTMTPTLATVVGVCTVICLSSGSCSLREMPQSKHLTAIELLHPSKASLYRASASVRIEGVNPGYTTAVVPEMTWLAIKITSGTVRPWMIGSTKSQRVENDNRLRSFRVAEKRWFNMAVNNCVPKLPAAVDVGLVWVVRKTPGIPGVLRK